MRVLVTGASGFLGQYVVDTLLSHGHEVIAVSRQIHKRVNNVWWFHADLFNEKTLRSMMESVRPEGLVHLAWQNDYNNRWTSINNLHASTATIKLLEEFALSGGKKIVATGTCAEYDWQYENCKEGITPIRPDTIYGKSKDITRQIGQEICNKNDISFVWARIFFAYGMGENINRLIPYTVNQLLHKKVVKCSHGNQLRDYIHAKDVASALTIILENGLSGEVYNVSTGAGVKIKDIVSTCASIIDPNGQIDFGSIILPKNEPEILIGDNSKLRSLGWSLENIGMSSIQSYINQIKDLKKI